MKIFLSLLILFIYINPALADRPVQSARMGKIGGLHPNSWKISEEVDKKGKGQEYTFNISIYNQENLLDFFSFNLNEGAKNSKKSQFSIQGDLKTEKFGTDISIEFIKDIPENKQIKANLNIKGKYIKNILYFEKNYTPSFIISSIDEEISISTKSHTFIKIDNDISIKIDIDFTK